MNPHACVGCCQANFLLLVLLMLTVFDSSVHTAVVVSFSVYAGWLLVLLPPCRASLGYAVTAAALCVEWRLKP